MDKNKVLPVMTMYDLENLVGAMLGPTAYRSDVVPVLSAQRDADFAILEQIAEAAAKIDRRKNYDYREVCTGCWALAGRPHEADCPWAQLEALGIVEKA